MSFTVTIVGLGLMGGSAAMAGRGFCDCVMQGIDCCFQVVNKALDLKIIDVGGYLDEDIKKMLSVSDFTVLCLHPEETLEFLRKYADAVKANSLVTDVVGIKSAVVAAAKKQLAQAEFLGGHPMAGREQSGLSAAVGDLFLGCNYVITPSANNKKSSVELLERWARYLGAAKITYTTPQRHDKMIAYTSQMAHVLAAAIADMGCFYESKGFEGGSFRDLTRVATLNPDMWSELFTMNRDCLCEILDELQENIGELRTKIKSNDKEAVKCALEASTSRKEAWLNWQNP